MGGILRSLLGLAESACTVLSEWLVAGLSFLMRRRWPCPGRSHVNFFGNKDHWRSFQEVFIPYDILYHTRPT